MNSHAHYFVSRTKSKTKKIEMRQNIVELPGKTTPDSLSEVPREVKHSFASDIVNEFSRLHFSPLEAGLIFQTSRFLSKK